MIIGGAGLAGQVMAFQYHGAGAGTGGDHIAQNAGDQKCIFCCDHARGEVRFGGFYRGDIGREGFGHGGRRGGTRRIRLALVWASLNIVFCGIQAGTGKGRVGDFQNLMIGIFDARDEVRFDAIAAIGEYRKCRGHLQRRHRRGPQDQGQVARQLGGVEAEARHIIGGIVGSDGAQQAHRDQVEG